MDSNEFIGEDEDELNIPDNWDDENPTEKPKSTPITKNIENKKYKKSYKKKYKKSYKKKNNINEDNLLTKKINDKRLQEESELDIIREYILD